jgi:hypothetical protein
VEDECCHWALNSRTDLEQAFISAFTHLDLDLEDCSSGGQEGEFDDELDEGGLEKCLLLAVGALLVVFVAVDEIVVEDVLFRAVEEVANYA